MTPEPKKITPEPSPRQTRSGLKAKTVGSGKENTCRFMIIRAMIEYIRATRCVEYIRAKFCIFRAEGISTDVMRDALRRIRKEGMCLPRKETDFETFLKENELEREDPKR